MSILSGPVHGSVESYAWDVNDSGTVVGFALDTQREASAFLWTPSAGFLHLGSLGGVGAQAFGVSESGIVVGLSGLSGSSYTNHAFRWTRASGMMDLGTLPGGSESGANDVNSAGEVAGYSNESPLGETRAVKWTASGAAVALPLPSDVDVLNSTAYDIDERGNVVGQVVLVDATARPVLWPASGGVVLLSVDIPDFRQGYAKVILENGQVVGTLATRTQGYGAAVWSGTVPR